jgi:hypothetical protein
MVGKVIDAVRDNLEANQFRNAKQEAKARSC